MCFAQVLKKGTITDTDGTPMAGVIIQVRSNSTNKIISFGKSDVDGNFTIKVADNSYLEVSMLGFKKQRFDNLTDEKPLQIVMQEDAVALKGVTVKANMVRENGDTLTYNVAAYADKNDRSLGDVLARIPGFEVNKESGQILYEGKAISKFYIEGLDMLGGKYGVATNSLPQVDVGSVQVMRNHQPIRVLENFTFTDEAAVNIRMKEGARNHWVTSFNGGAGISHHTGLWSFEGFGLRLKPEYQTMITYKTNNTGQDISKETTSLFNHDDLEIGSSHINLSRPTTPNLANHRSLFNRSHSVTANAMKRFNESSQMNTQIIYTNSRETAVGERHTEYFLNEGNRIIDSRKNYMQKDNKLYALVKYECNRENYYLKNSLSGDLKWCRQWLDETGVAIHNQYARKPEYDLKDNLHIIRKYGNRLVSFFSNNRIVLRPQSLTVDTLFQHIGTQRYSTDTYAMGGIRFGDFGLSLKIGVNAVLNCLESRLTGLSNLTKQPTNDERYSYASFYVEPTITYDISDIKIEFSPVQEYMIEKYSRDAMNSIFPFSPGLRINWDATPRLRMSLRAYSYVENPDINHFYHSVMLQDYQYIKQGYTGYSHNRNTSVRTAISYADAIKALHTSLSISRDFKSSPYTPTQQFVDDYIVVSAIEQKNRSDSWKTDLRVSKGTNFLHSKIDFTVSYTHRDASMLQNGELTDYNNQGINIRTQLDFSFWKDMRLRYGFVFNQNRMKIQSMHYTQATDGWKQNLSVIIPIDPFSIDVRGEYYRNEITSGNYKNFFLADIKAGYKTKHLDLSLSLNNLLNHDTYSYVITSDLSSSTSTNHIRGREVLISLYYKP